PWTAEGPAFGFSAGEPWLPMPAHWGAASVAAQRDDASSTLALFRAALALRPHGRFAWQDSPSGALVFTRDELTCLVNVEGDPLPLPPGEVRLASEPVDGSLPAGAAAWVHT
ncbi:MAG: alpha-glucosidase, partial [Actinobacteria bacterium]|nr:alpha-glucosidase [Actinomycetota bacterium]